jgi:hypothetical protein
MLARRTGDTSSVIKYYCQHISYILNHATIRTHVSLLETYADDNNDLTRQAAAVSVLCCIRTERLARMIMRPNNNLAGKSESLGTSVSGGLKLKQLFPNISIYPGHNPRLSYASLVAPDSIRAMFKRMRVILRGHPALWLLACKIIKTEMSIPTNIFKVADDLQYYNFWGGNFPKTEILKDEIKELQPPKKQ